MRNAFDLFGLGAVLCNVQPDEPLGEHAALGEVIVVALERVESLAEIFGQTAEL